MGVPGSGKDTQAQLLESEKGFKVIRIGHIIRELAKHDKILDRTQKHGDLADEDLVNRLMSKALDGQPDNSNILSDGYPRSLSQAKALEAMCLDKKIDFVKVLYLHIPREETISRLKLRARADDTNDTIENRLKIFSNSTIPVIQYFKSKKVLNEIDGLGSVEDVHKRIINVLNQ